MNFVTNLSRSSSRLSTAKRKVVNCTLIPWKKLESFFNELIRLIRLELFEIFY